MSVSTCPFDHESCQAIDCDCFCHGTVQRDPQPPSQGTVFRRRLEQLRMELGVRCETCEFFSSDDLVEVTGGTCTLVMEWTGRSDFCRSWQERTSE